MIKNGCTDTITASNPRSRLGLPDFALSTPLPATLALGQKLTLSVAFTPSGQGPREDVLFVDVTEQGAPVRFPFTLSAVAP